MRSIIIVFLILVSHLVWAQYKIDRFSISPKIGGQIDVSGNLRNTYSLGLNFFSPKNVYSGQYIHSSESLLFASSGPKETRDEIGVMLGRYFGEGYLRFECQFGLGLVWGINRGEQIDNYGSGYQYEIEKFTTIGIPLKLGFKFIPAKFISIGLDLQSNINLESSYFTIFLGLEFGILRNQIKPRPID